MPSQTALEVLGCPECRQPLKRRPYTNYLCASSDGRFVYEDTLGIPNLLPIQLSDARYAGPVSPPHMQITQ